MVIVYRNIVGKYSNGESRVTPWSLDSVIRRMYSLSTEMEKTLDGHKGFIFGH
jgi:hypothetical protein